MQQFTVQIPDAENLDPSDLAHFLFLFRGAYAAALPGSPNEDPEQCARRVSTFLTRAKPSTVDALFSEDLGDSALSTVKITYASPLQIVFVGVVAALTTAVVLSGGKIKVPLVSAEVNALGDGIKKLRAAFTRSTHGEIGYGLRGTTVKLSKDEYTELAKHENARGGGFQRFLRSLALRVNRTTRTLDLTDDDIDKIVKHGRQSGAGGFQRRIKKIFGRHFSL